MSGVFLIFVAAMAILLCVGVLLALTLPGVVPPGRPAPSSQEDTDRDT